MKRLIFSTVVALSVLTAGAEYKRVFTVPTPDRPTPEPADRVARRIGAEPLVNSDARARARAEREAQMRAQAAAALEARTNAALEAQFQAQAQASSRIEREVQLRVERESQMRVESERVQMLREKERLAFAFRVTMAAGLLLFAGWFIRRITTRT